MVIEGMKLSWGGSPVAGSCSGRVPTLFHPGRRRLGRGLREAGCGRLATESGKVAQAASLWDSPTSPFLPQGRSSQAGCLCHFLPDLLRSDQFVLPEISSSSAQESSDELQLVAAVLGERPASGRSTPSRAEAHDYFASPETERWSAASPKSDQFVLPETSSSSAQESSDELQLVIAALGEERADGRSTPSRTKVHDYFASPATKSRNGPGCNSVQFVLPTQGPAPRLRRGRPCRRCRSCGPWRGRR